MPASGFWLFIPQALIILISQKNQHFLTQCENMSNFISRCWVDILKQWLFQDIEFTLASTLSV